MAIDLLNSFIQRGKNLSSNQTGTNAQVQTQAMQNTPHNMQVMRAIRALQAGSTLQGEVVSVNGNEVQLAIMKDVLIEAKLAQSMNLTQGMSMTFQVKSNNSQGLSLLPLFTNTSLDPNAMKALDMAGIGVNERSLEMVQTMMEKGMPIDKQSIQEVYREVVAFKDGIVRDIVSLHQMKIPVTEENLTQISLYQNNQHYLEEGFSEIGKSIGQHLAQLASSGKTAEAAELVQKLEEFFKLYEENGNSTSVEHKESNSENSVGLTSMAEDSEMLSINAKEQLMSEGKTKDSGEIILEKNSAESEVSEEKNVLKENSKQLPENEKDWKMLTRILLKEENESKVSKLFQKIWDKSIGKQWMLEPEMVRDKEKVSQYFEKLTRQMKQLEGIFEQEGYGKSDVAKVLHNTSSNLDFMNQLNQMHAYIQLPLKMAHQTAKGELYVFTNKRSLSGKEGKITALLHLDMEHLGKMDVYVALEETKVSTNFYLEKEEYLDFIESHMDMLTERINNRGFQCEVKTSLRSFEEGEAMIKTIEKEQNGPMLLSMQAFDMRA